MDGAEGPNMRAEGPRVEDGAEGPNMRAEGPRVEDLPLFWFKCIACASVKSNVLQ